MISELEQDPRYDRDVDFLYKYRETRDVIKHLFAQNPSPTSRKAGFIEEAICFLTSTPFTRSAKQWLRLEGTFSNQDARIINVSFLVKYPYVSNPLASTENFDSCDIIIGLHDPLTNARANTDLPANYKVGDRNIEKVRGSVSTLNNDIIPLVNDGAVKITKSEHIIFI